MITPLQRWGKGDQEGKEGKVAKNEESTKEWVDKMFEKKDDTQKKMKSRGIQMKLLLL